MARRNQPWNAKQWLPNAQSKKDRISALRDKYINDSRDLYPDSFEIEKYLIGCTIGTHVGPGAIAVAFFANSK